MTAERPWHATAREMRAEGASHRKIAAVVGVSHNSVARFLDRAYAQRCYRRRSERRRERLATEPGFREVLSQARRRSYLRSYAKDEAAETGRPYEEICAQWEIA